MVNLLTNADNATKNVLLSYIDDYILQSSCTIINKWQLIN